MEILKDVCGECGGSLEVTNDMEGGDLISCPDCGLDYVVEVNDKGVKILSELNLECEDWGE